MSTLNVCKSRVKLYICNIDVEIVEITKGIMMLFDYNAFQKWKPGALFI